MKKKEIDRGLLTHLLRTLVIHNSIFHRLLLLSCIIKSTFLEKLLQTSKLLKNKILIMWVRVFEKRDVTKNVKFEIIVDSFLLDQDSS